MPRKAHWCNGGAVGTIVTPRMVAYLLELQDLHDSRQTAVALGIAPATLAVTVRYIERKIGRKLFHRAIGRSASAWWPMDSAQDFFEWCGSHPRGGADWPKVLDACKSQD